jgi:CRISPR-associated protein Csm5
MTYILKVLTPVHIHSGETLRSINYMVKDHKILIFDEMDVIQSVKENEILNDELLRNFTADNRRTEYNKTLDYYIHRGIIHTSIVDKYRIKAVNRAGDLTGQEIYRTMMNIQGSYIPGSTLKGVVRTAIFYDYLLNKGIDYIKKAVSFLDGKWKLTIDDYILYGVDDGGWLHKDIQKDPFRFLGIKDINMIEKKLEIYQETIYNVSKFIPRNVIETIGEGDYSEEFEFEIRLNEYLFKMYNEEIISYFNEKELLRVLYQYSKDIIDDELEYYSSQKHPLFNTREIVEKLEEIGSKNSIKSPVLRIGKGKGYKSNTVALVIKKLDKNYYLKKTKNIAKPFKYNKQYEYPKTRKFIDLSISPKLLGFTILEKVAG